VIAESLNKRLNYYALAASAAGVSLLSLSQPANAEIIFTPANVTTGAPGSTYNLDLDNDALPTSRSRDTVMASPTHLWPSM
jgi:hypothetical protein